MKWFLQPVTNHNVFSIEIVQIIPIVFIAPSSIDDVYWPAKILKDSGIKILCVGVGRYFNIYQLNAIASRPTAKNVFTGDFSKIQHVIDELVKQICKGKDGKVRTYGVRVTRVGFTAGCSLL